MPKLLINAKKTIKDAGKKLLAEESAGQFTITELAKKSCMSRQTLYFRFTNKEALVKAVALDDWAEQKEELAKEADRYSLPEEKAHWLYDRLTAFWSRYKDFYFDIFAGGGLLRTSEDLAGQLSDITGLSRFVVEVILTFVSMPDVDYKEIEPQIKKVL